MGNSYDISIMNKLILMFLSVAFSDTELDRRSFPNIVDEPSDIASYQESYEEDLNLIQSQNIRGFKENAIITEYSTNVEKDVIDPDESSLDFEDQDTSEFVANIELNIHDEHRKREETGERITLFHVIAFSYFINNFVNCCIYLFRAWLEH